MVKPAFPVPPASHEGISEVGFYAALFLQGYIAKEGMEGDFVKLSEKAIAIADTFRDTLSKEGKD